MLKARNILLMVLALLVSGAVVSAKKSAWADQARQRKADYLYLESLNQDLADNSDAAYELLVRAHALNPGDNTIGYQLSNYLLNLLQNDTSALTRARALIENYYRENPDDFYGDVMYATLLEYLGEGQQAIEVWENVHRRFPDNSSVTYKLAGNYASLHDTTAVRRAIELYDTIMMAEGESAELLMSKMRLLYMLGDTVSMVRQAETTLASPEGMTADNLIMAGTIFHALELNDRALECLQQACVADSTSGMAFYTLASFYNELGDSAAYDREIYNALTRTSLEPEIKGELLRDYIVNHINDTLAEPRIHQLFATLIDMHPHDASVRNSYTDYLIFLKRYGDAAEQLSYSLDLDPDQEEMWERLTQLYEIDEQYEKSIAAAADGAHYFPNNAKLPYFASIDCVMLEDYPRAVEYNRQAFAVTDSTDYEMLTTLWCARGDIYYKMGDVDSSFMAYEHALTYDPESSLTLNNYAYFLAVAERDLDHAQQMVEKALRIDPENINAVDTYAWVLFKKKEYQRAREVFDSAIDQMLDPDNPSAEAYEHAGDIYFMTGDVDQAVEYWETAITVDPDNELLKKKVQNKTYFFK